MSFGLGIIGLIIWIAIAFWPAGVAARKGHSAIGYFNPEPRLLSARADHGLRGAGPKRPRSRVGQARNRSSDIARQSHRPSRAAPNVLSARLTDVRQHHTSGLECPQPLILASVGTAPNAGSMTFATCPKLPGLLAPEPECVTSIRRYLRVGGESAASPIGHAENGPSSPERRPCALRGTGCRPTPKRHGVQGGPGPARGAIASAAVLRIPTPLICCAGPVAGS